ncbi:MAG: right-handed parallel beta-helix repeat-containing protein [Planctomycetales bacterium]|nr:right-handed parallel beta-helix repeat-containing protein [Planctomycetales bacterium]
MMAKRWRTAAAEGLETRRMLTDWFVATDGNNSSAGSSTAPWATLQYAADRVHAGDTVHVAAGEYVGFHLTRDGMATARIVFSGGRGVVINQPNTRTADGINLEGADFITIDGFEVVGMPRAGIRSVANSDAQIFNNDAHDNGRWGIFSGFSENIHIENNRTFGSQLEHGIYVSNSSDSPIIRGNIIANNYGNGIHMNGDVSQGGDGVISQALIENNVIYENGRGGGSGINLDGVQNSTVQNNLLYNNHASGISLYRIDGGAGSSGNIIQFNTVYQASDARWALNIQDASTSNTIHHNVLLTAHSFRGSIDVSLDSRAGLSSDYNVVADRFTLDAGDTRLTLAAWRAATGQDAHSRVGSAHQVFADLQSSDFRLIATSAAADIGPTSTLASIDLLGLRRAPGQLLDAGAYAWNDRTAGDVNGDDLVNATDIDLLFAARRAGDNDARFDLNGDQQVDDQDVEVLLSDILHTGAGDANLDGVFDSSDLVEAFQHGEYEDLVLTNSSWQSGDWDGDGEFTTADLVAAFQLGTYIG